MSRLTRADFNLAVAEQIIRRRNRAQALAPSRTIELAAASNGS